jgi:phage baseplate assembly protein V
MLGTIGGMSGKTPSPVELLRLIENIVRAGTVMAVDHGAHLCRVKSGGNETNWLPWFARRAGDVRHWSPPSVGEQCMVLSPGGDMASGFVLVGLYSDNVPANGSSGDVERTTYPDGAVFEYDHAAHALKVTLPGGGTADITVPDSIKVSCDTADVTAASSAVLHSQLITLDAPQTRTTGNLEVGGMLTMAAGGGGGGVGARTQLRGPVELVDGDLTAPDHDLVAKGISLSEHRHEEVAMGGDISGGPVA